MRQTARKLKKEVLTGEEKNSEKANNPITKQ